MNQVLLRLTPHLHDRVRARAAREGRSVNATVADLLDAVVDTDLGSEGDRRSRLVARARQLDLLGSPSSAVVGSAPERRALIRQSTGAGPWLLDDLAADRGAR